MRLSEAERQALRDRAAGLRNEVSALTAERDSAYREAELARTDAKLVGEVVALEQRRDDAKVARDRASGTVDEAMLMMERAINQAGVAANSNAAASQETQARDVDSSSEGNALKESEPTASAVTSAKKVGR